MTSSMPVQALPRSLDPLAGESLPGYVLRLAHRLERAPGRIAVLTGLGRQLPRRSTLIVPASQLLHLQPATSATFAHATRLSAQEAAGLCLDSVRVRYPPVDLTWQAGVLRQASGIAGLASWVFSRSTRYCPQCLVADGSAIQQAHGAAWQKLWHLPAVFACTIHERLLLHQCPQCHQPVHARHGGSLLPRLHDPTLHPAQCRTTIGAGAHWRAQSACGARLDSSTGPTAAGRHDPALEPLLAVQRKLLGLLAPDGPLQTPSAGQPTTTAQYFLDLRLLVGLLCTSWPQGRQAAAPWIAVEAIDGHLDRQRRQAADRLQQGRKLPYHLAVSDRLPVESPACGGLLALADQLLALDEPAAVQQRLEPLLARASAHSPWVRHLLHVEVDCSPGLRTAIGPHVRMLRTGTIGPHASSGGRSRPTRDHAFGPQHIPQYLPADWYDRHLRDLTGINPLYLRRFASIALVQVAAGRSRQAAARLLGLPSGRCAATCYHVQRWTRDTSNSPRLHAALEALASELDATSDLIDYRQRRDALTGWSIPADDWLELAADVKQRQRGRASTRIDWSDRKRLVASVLVWARVTEGEYRFAPLLADQWPPRRRRELARRIQQTSCWGRTGRPEHHYVALLAALDAYAHQLAVRIDAGWTPPPDQRSIRQPRLRHPAT
jgi:TniQ